MLSVAACLAPVSYCAPLVRETDTDTIYRGKILTSLFYKSGSCMYLAPLIKGTHGCYRPLEVLYMQVLIPCCPEKMSEEDDS